MSRKTGMITEIICRCLLQSKAHFLLYKDPDRLLCDICKEKGDAADIRYCCLDCDDCVICENCWEGEKLHLL